MTKNDEIEYLRKFIGGLPTNTYSGSWLTEQLPALEASIRSDVLAGTYFCQSHVEFFAERQRQVSDAQEKANNLINAAKAEADKIVEKARQDASHHRNWLLRKIEETRSALQGY